MTEENPYAAPGAELSVESEIVVSALATRWSRLLARLADGIANSVAFGPLLLGVFFLLPGHEFYLLAGIFGLAGLFALFHWIRYNVRMMSKNGQTFGKIAMGIRVVRVDGSRLTLLRWFTHRFLVISLLSSIPWIGWFVALANYLAIFRKSRQCLHDQVADTKVVRV
jgi:uncharacterized RDD family membrane protein YckC